jgi:hypothetical protein
VANVADGVDGHIDDDGSAVLCLAERCEVCGQPFRQHRKHFGGRVDGRGVLGRVAIDG